MHFMSWVRSSQKEILSRGFKCKWFIRAVLPGVQNGEGGELRKETSGEIPGSARFQKKRYSVNCEFVMTQGNWALCLFMDSLWVTPGRQTPGHFRAAPHKSKVAPVTPGKSSEKCYKQNVQKGKHTSRVKKIEESDQGINWGILSLLLCGYLGKYSTIPLNPIFHPFDFPPGCSSKSYPIACVDFQSGKWERFHGLRHELVLQVTMTTILRNRCKGILAPMTGSSHKHYIH